MIEENTKSVTVTLNREELEMLGNYWDDRYTCYDGAYHDEEHVEMLAKADFYESLLSDLDDDERFYNEVNAPSGRTYTEEEVEKYSKQNLG